MTYAHTPGPWEIKWIGGGKQSPIIPTNAPGSELFEPIAIVPHDDYTEHGLPEIRANAALIAAAPETAAERDKLREINAELLKALANILYAHDTGNNGAAMGEASLCFQYAEAARAAIAKARGKP